MDGLYDVDCIVCGVLIKDWDPKICCNGYMCGCLGKPTEPQICSNRCYDIAFKGERNVEKTEVPEGYFALKFFKWTKGNWECEEDAPDIEKLPEDGVPPPELVRMEEHPTKIGYYPVTYSRQGRTFDGIWCYHLKLIQLTPQPIEPEVSNKVVIPDLVAEEFREYDDGKNDIILTLQKERCGYEGKITISEELYTSLGFTYEQVKNDHAIIGAILYAIGSGVIEGATKKKRREADGASEKGAEPSGDGS